MIKYWGTQDKLCDMCTGYKKNQQLYLDNKSALKGLFPEVEWKSQLICTKCAKREVGKKQWNEVKRSPNG